MFTKYGFTAVFDIGSPLENTRRLRDRIESGEVPGPQIVGGHHAKRTDRGKGPYLRSPQAIVPPVLRDMDPLALEAVGQV
jgi:hypothetical protein